MANITPKAVQTKIYKTGQTRGADDDVIFQNRVGRNSTVLIPFNEFKKCKTAPSANGCYENGFIVLITPEDYFNAAINSTLASQGLILGTNLLVFYETRTQWNQYPPLQNWRPASARKAPLSGEYVARVPATTAEGGSKIIQGFNTSRMKGAGIRVYEYADSWTISLCKVQLEYLFWSCKDINEFVEELELDKTKVNKHIEQISAKAEEYGLIDKEALINARIIDKAGFTICPLCLKHISAKGFCSRIQQAEGRFVPDLTVTEISLFHIRELRTGEFNHKPYNLGWGHHHCNVVVKDSGIETTLEWMREIIIRNNKYFQSK